jgi:hypothetical protein
MKKMLLMCVLGICGTSALFAQTTTRKAPAGQDLVAWTPMQTPKPIPAAPGQTPTTPEPTPETPPVDRPTSAQPSQPGEPTRSQGQSPGEQAQPAAQTFTGTISKEADSYVLKVSDTSSYKLDDQDQAKQYEGQRVRVIGSLDMGSNLIKVQRIEPLS